MPINTHHILHSWLVPVSEQKNAFLAEVSHEGWQKDMFLHAHLWIYFHE